MQALELRIPPVALVFIFAGLMALGAYVLPFAVGIPAAIFIAVALFLVGAAVAIAGVLAFKRNKTTVNPFTPERTSTLVTTGIYRFTRNPMYLGFLLALAGWAVLLSNLVAFALLPVFIAYMNRFQIEPEERALMKHFGADYQAYMRSVRRWL
jgi:protein-S-isoprenylcysteine O-methyltransferase Ste14